MFLLSDATATTGPDADKWQRYPLDLIGEMFGHVVSVSEMLQVIENSGPDK